MLEKFVATHPTPAADAVEARQRLADYAEHAADHARQTYWYREIVQADAQAGAGRTDRTRYLAAKAQIQLATPARDAFRDVKLVLPLKKSLVAKRKALDAALAAYKRALDYQVAETTTAATFEMAELYRQLAKDIMSSERPKKLSKDERQQYDSLLEEQVYPFEEQAINLHEANAARAKEGLYDDWVKKSYGVLAELKPARYAKSEISQDVVTTLK
jgi:cellulose synthase operon protein C